MRIFSATTLLIAVILQGCASSVTTDRPDDYYVSSLKAVAANDEVLSNEGIAELMSADFKLAPQIRIGIIDLTPESSHYYLAETNKVSDELIATFFEKLKESNRIFDVSYVPSLIVPSDRSVPRLRTAAARYQADLLLVFSQNCTSYSKHEMFEKTRFKATCTLESLVLDTVTGLAPFSVVASNESYTVKSKEDYGYADAAKKNSQDAQLKNWSELADKILVFVQEN